MILSLLYIIEIYFSKGRFFQKKLQIWDKLLKIRKGEQSYRYLDKLSDNQHKVVQNISVLHTKMILGGHIGVLFYDVTTLYFEADYEDDLRKTGFSKEGRHHNPQIILGLLVSIGGYPLAYCICFVALKVYKELERLLKLSDINMSVDKVLELAKNIVTIQITLPQNKQIINRTMLMKRHQRIAQLFSENFWVTR